ncbi:hypothetical protein H4582DRAFT_2068416 [Lactarius indigo]|nr:hypothetical protein H4582DRAFT_2068416 [Lactarius indigo]
MSHWYCLPAGLTTSQRWSMGFRVISTQHRWSKLNSTGLNLVGIELVRCDLLFGLDGKDETSARLELDEGDFGDFSWSRPEAYGTKPPNPVLHPVATRPDEWARAAIAPGVEVAERDGRTATSTREDSSKSAPVQQKKSYPNKEVSKGVWQFRVEVDRDQVRQTFAAQTDMTWPDFEAEALERFNAHEDVRLGYRVSGGNRTWVSLTCPSDWKVAVATVQEKALVARTRTVTMEIKDVSMLGQLKTCGKGKKKEKRSRDDDIPPEATPEAKSQYNHLLSLQRHLLCSEHSKAAGLRKYCWIEPSSPGIQGGHKDIKHGEMTLWAKLIAIGKADVFLRPNTSLSNCPPTKKPRGAGARAAPEVHIAINITPTPGAGGSQNSYVVSGTQVQPGSGLGPSYATQISDITVHTEAPASTPMESESPSPPAYGSPELLADCRSQGRVPLVYEILTLMDIEEPVPNLTYLDSHTDLFNFGYNDAIQLFELDESLLSGFGLGTENARRIHRFIRDKFFEPLGLMVTSEVPPSTEVVAPTAPAVQDIMERSNGVESRAIKKEERDVLTIPGEVIDISEGEDEIEEAEDKEIEDEEEEIDEEEGVEEIDEDEIDELESEESDIGSVTAV